jgi:hypothetical protein
MNSLLLRLVRFDQRDGLYLGSPHSVRAHMAVKIRCFWFCFLQVLYRLRYTCELSRL